MKQIDPGHSGVKAKVLSRGRRRPRAPERHRQPFAAHLWLSLWDRLSKALIQLDSCEDKEEMGREWQVLDSFKEKSKGNNHYWINPVVHQPESTLESLRHAFIMQSPRPLSLKILIA